MPPANTVALSGATNAAVAAPEKQRPMERVMASGKNLIHMTSSVVLFFIDVYENQHRLSLC